MELLIQFLWVPVLGASFYTIAKMYKTRHHLHTANLFLQQEFNSAKILNDSLQKEQSAFVSELAQRNTELYTLHEELKNIYNAQSTQEHSQSELQAKLHALEGQLFREQETLRTEQKENLTYSAAIEQLKERLNQQITSGSSVEEQLRSKIDTMELFIGDQKKHIQMLNDERASFNAQIAALDEKNELRELEHHVTIEANAERESEFHRLADEQLLKLQSEIEQLKSQFAQKETALRETLKENENTILNLQQHITKLNELLQQEKNARDGTEQSAHGTEVELNNLIASLKEEQSLMSNELLNLQTKLDEELKIRIATETALQESKEKLYAVIRELEQKLDEQRKNMQSAFDDMHNAFEKTLTKTQQALYEEEIHVLEHQEKNSELQERVNTFEKSVHAVVQKAPLGACIIDSQGNFTAANNILCDLYNASAEELLGKNFSVIFPEEERTFFLEQWSSHANLDEQFHGDATIVATTEERISVYFTIAAIPGNGAKRYVGFLLDKTKEHEADENFKIAIEKADELRDLKSRFIFIVSNQLRASIVTIASNTELLERFYEKWSDERRYQAFYRINESLNDVKDLLHDVVFTTNAATMKCSPAVIDLELLCQSIANEVQNDLEAKQHFVFIEQGNVKEVLLDEQLLRAIMNNLLSNAFKYSSNNSEVTLRLLRNEDHCIISVTDQGIGIPAKDQQHLFDTFFRGSNVGNVFGTGLGLTIVQQCVQIHGGTLSIESALKIGTTVTVTIPVC